MAPFYSFKSRLAAACLAVRPGNVFEWGPGTSTRLIRRLVPGARIHGVEHSGRWFRRYASEFRGDPKVQLHLVRYSKRLLGCGRMRNEGYATTPLRLEALGVGPRHYDMMFVDGRARAECLAVAARMIAPGGLVLLHDADRPRYRAALEMFSERCADTHECTAVLAHDPMAIRAFHGALAQGGLPHVPSDHAQEESGNRGFVVSG